jgi:hypothetical protein
MFWCLLGLAAFTSNPAHLLLARVGLTEFESAFTAAGVDQTSDIVLLTDADLAGLGLNLVQRRRLQQHLGHDASMTASSVDGLRTFGSAGKAITLQPGENLLYNHTCEKGLCVLGHMWFGGAWSHYDMQRLRVYIDGEATASIDGQLFLLHGVGFADDAAPWSSGDLFGKTGSPSGTFNTFQIPFAQSIRVTMQCYDTVASPSTTRETFWWIFRGLEGEAQ